METSEGLGSVNARLLEQSAALVGLLEDDEFCSAEICPGGAGIGPQLRHCADFYRALLDGLAAGRVDYDARKRDPLFETHRGYAARERRAAPGIDAGRNGRRLGAHARELLVLLSHTVHHHALACERLRARGIDPGASFGVAPSPLAHANAPCAR